MKIVKLINFQSIINTLASKFDRYQRSTNLGTANQLRWYRA